MLARSEDMSRLIFDEKWGGADEVSVLIQKRKFETCFFPFCKDEAMLERERIEQQEKIRRAAEEQLLAAKLEEARREQEQQELLEREKRKRDEQGKKERVGMRGSSRSVRGTRTPMQAMRGAVSRGGKRQLILLSFPLINLSFSRYRHFIESTPSERCHKSPPQSQLHDFKAPRCVWFRDSIEFDPRFISRNVIVDSARVRILSLVLCPVDRYHRSP